MGTPRIMTSAPLVSTIVANWNGAKDLEFCLPSLRAQSYRPLEIIVVDNASTDDSAAVARNFGARWLGLDRNRGLAAALNRGAEAARGEFLLFLNNDMRFHEEFVEFMVSEIVGDRSVFSVDARQYDWDGTKEVHLATRLATKGGEGTRGHELTPGLHICQQPRDQPTAVLMSSAASMLARKSMFQRLGGFDEKLFFGYEDVDLCWRGWIQGWKTVFVPAAKCWHRVGHSSHSGPGRSLAFRGVLCGRLVVATKLLPWGYALRAWLTSLAGLARDVALLRRQAARDRIEVLQDCLRHLPTLLDERRELFPSQSHGPRAALDRLLQLAA
jgi:GT2 family glycosyltransferase